MAADRHGRCWRSACATARCSASTRRWSRRAPPPGLSRGDRARASARRRSGCCARPATSASRPASTWSSRTTREERFYFLEVNPRLQVEHGVTELLTDFDLVKTQIRIARGERLPRRGARASAATRSRCGCAPRIRRTRSRRAPARSRCSTCPRGPGVRVDSGIASGGTIPSEFDSMVAKVLARGSTREEARARLVRAVSDARVVVLGGMTNKGFLLDVLEHPDFRRGGVSTQLARRHAARRAARPRRSRR